MPGVHLSVVGMATAAIAIVAVIGLIIISVKAIGVAERAVNNSDSDSVARSPK